MTITLDPNNKGAGATLSNGNMSVAIATSTSTARATKGKTTGKWYWEVTYDGSVGTFSAMTGIVNATAGVGTVYTSTNHRGYYNGSGQKWEAGAGKAYGASYVIGDIIGTALDMDNGTITWYKNGVSQGTAFTNVKVLGEVFPSITSASSTSGCRATINFGATAFKYAIPAGYEAYITGSREATLLSKDGKGYSLDVSKTWYETRMTSNTAPAPLVASSSSVQSATFAPWKAFDGVISPNETVSSWSAQSALRNGWLQLDYGRQRLVNKVSITTLGYTTSPKDFQILGSNNNADWDTLLDVTNEVWQVTGSNEMKEYKFKNDANYRYYRINITTVSAPDKQPIITDMKYGYDRMEMTEISTITVDTFIKYGKPEFTDLTSEFDRLKYLLSNTTKEKKLDRKPLSISLN